MIPGQLALPAPYGSDSHSYVSVSLSTYYREFNVKKAVEALAAFGCEMKYIPKILSCLQHSGHYDCYLQYGWFSQISGHGGGANCKRMLRDAGVELTVLNIRRCNEYVEVSRHFR